jgi:peptidoglycan DL-endopeptidase CwlO
MSVVDVQQRIAALQARFVPAAAAAPPASGATRSAYSFAGALAGAQGAYVPISSGGGPDGPADGSAVVNSALRYQGVPYRWGGESPDGFDCSGLVQFVFGRHGVSLPRVAADQARAGTAVPLDDLRPGDLVFFGRPVDHVGIYYGDNKMVVAPKTGDVVKVQSFDPSTVTAARRVLPGRTAGLAGMSEVADGNGSWASRLPAAGKRFAGLIQQAATSAGIDPKLLAAVAWSESGFNPAAASGAGAVGLTQLMPGTAAGLGVNPNDPAQNLSGGARYLASQLQRFGRLDLALAAYNAGPSAVTKAGGVPPYPETQAYVARVLDRLQTLQEPT